MLLFTLPAGGLERVAATKFKTRAEPSTKVMADLARQLGVPPGELRSLLEGMKQERR
jgi:hypothetical protein